jgi:tetratricopeptide (TPR) repeat protein
MAVMRGITVLVVCFMAATAAAQTPNPRQSEADKYFTEGRDLLVNKKDAPAACKAFEKAIELDPTAPGVMLNLGLCYELQGKYATSLYWFRKAQFAAAEAKPKPLTDYEDEAKKHTQDLADKVAIAQLKDVPDVARVSIDGRPVRREDYLRLEVDADSVIEVRAPGKQPFQQKVEVDGKNAKDVVIVMKDEVIPPMRDPGKGRRRLAYIVAAGGVVIWGLTLAYGLRVRDLYESPGGAYGGPDGFDEAKDDLRFKGTAMFAVGTAAVGAAIVLYVTAPKPYRERSEQGRILPLVSPDHVGFGYARSF